MYAGNKYFRNPEVTINYIVALVNRTNSRAVRSTIDKYNIYIPTANEVMDMVLYRLENSNFKGKFLIVGDFCQIPPIIKDKRVKDIFAFESKLWYSLNLKIVYLEEIKILISIAGFKNNLYLCSMKIIQNIKK